jgi:hypothetical protein
MSLTSVSPLSLPCLPSASHLLLPSVFSLSPPHVSHSLYLACCLTPSVSSLWLFFSVSSFLSLPLHLSSSPLSLPLISPSLSLIFCVVCLLLYLPSIDPFCLTPSLPLISSTIISLLPLPSLALHLCLFLCLSPYLSTYFLVFPQPVLCFSFVSLPLYIPSISTISVFLSLSPSSFSLLCLSLLSQSFLLCFFSSVSFLPSLLLCLSTLSLSSASPLPLFFSFPLSFSVLFLPYLSALCLYPFISGLLYFSVSLLLCHPSLSLLLFLLSLSSIFLP